MAHMRLCLPRMEATLKGAQRYTGGSSKQGFFVMSMNFVRSFRFHTQFRVKGLRGAGLRF